MIEQPQQSFQDNRPVIFKDLDGNILEIETTWGEPRITICCEQEGSLSGIALTIEQARNLANELLILISEAITKGQ